MMTKAIQI